jgi:galactose mutarotase-like enzyme
MPTVMHSTLDKDGAILDILEDGNGHRLVINRLGAEMIGLQKQGADNQWQGFLHRDGEVAPPASGWANHATVMGYFLHRLVGEQSHYRDSIIRGGNHGFLRHFQFETPRLSGSTLTYSVHPDRIPPEAYPLRVGLELSYTLIESGVRVGFCFHNFETGLDAHVSFGIHPGFAVRSPLNCRVTFPPGHYVRHFAPDNFLDGTTQAFDFPGGDMPFPRSELPGSFLISLAGVPFPVFQVEDAGRRVDLDFSGVPYMTVWSDGGPFLCLEPCWGLPDSKPQTPFQEKAGIQVLAPGATLEAYFEIHMSFTP